MALPIMSPPELAQVERGVSQKDKYRGDHDTYEQVLTCEGG